MTEPERFIQAAMIDPERSILAARQAANERMAARRTGGPVVVYAAPNVVGDEPPKATNDDEAVVCAICNVPLNQLTESSTGGQVWLHSRSWIAYDHDPEPKIILKTESPLDACDFCGAIGPMWVVYEGDRVRMDAGHTTNDYGTTWSSCRECADIIDRDILADRTQANYTNLAMRVLRVSPTKTPKEIQYEQGQAYIRLWATFLPTVRRRIFVGPKREPARLDARMMPKLQLGLVKFWKHRILRDKVTGKYVNQQTHSLPGVHVGQPEAFLVRYGVGEPLPVEGWTNHTNHIVAGIWVSDLYWISERFTRLAIMAGHDFDKLVLTRETLPSKFGFMMFAEPIGEFSRPGGIAAIRGVSWTLVPEGIWLNIYLQGEDADHGVDIETMRAELGWLLCPNPGSGFRFDDEMDLTALVADGVDISQSDTSRFDIIRTVFAAWFLLAQPGVAEASDAPVDKKAARAYQRANNRPLPKVQLIDLRHQPRRASPDAEHRTGRPLEWRVYRRGHWKRQAFGPKRGQRRLIYVSPYLAGPEDAPFKEKPPTVKVLR